MNPTLLFYNLSFSDKMTLVSYVQSIGVTPIEIKETDGNQTVGYLLGYPTFKISPVLQAIKGEEPFIYMAHMDKQTVFSLIDALKQKNIHVSLKAMQTPTNINYTISEFYAHLIEERNAMKGR